MVNEFRIKQEICETGRRVYERGFVAANDGNISYRIGENQVLCSPTLVSKGFMKPDDICLVDMTGRQLAGRRKRTSEVLLHLEIYKRAPEIKAVVHCHPPHATAFSVAGEEIPTCVLPEFEVFLGPVPTATYETPGAQGFADTVTPHIGRSKIVVLKNHGTVAWADTLERALWWTEILDAYCRILLIAKQVGRVERLPTPKVQELLDLKNRFGITDDPRSLQSADLCVNTEWGRGFAQPDCGCGLPAAAQASAASGEVPADGDEIERIVQAITDRIMAAMR